VLALQGRCRGSLLRAWADNVRRRFGDDAVRLVREELGPLSPLLPDDPDAGAWLPVAAQIRATDVIIDRLLGGDAAAIEPLLHEDTERARDRALSWVVRHVGPAVVLRRAGALHPHLYDVGRVTASARGGRATIGYSDAELFENPTFRVLQALGVRIFLAMSRREGVVVTGPGGGVRSFTLDVTWRDP
jgi:hypothetical protein